MTQLETAMALLMKVFDTYAAGEGKPDTLTKAEAKTLLEKELPGLLKVRYTRQHIIYHLKQLANSHFNVKFNSDFYFRCFHHCLGNVFYSFSGSST